MARHQLIQNNKGMACQLTAMAYGRDGDDFYRRLIYALDIAGAQSQVKAIWATLHSRGPMRTFGVGENYKKFRGIKDVKYQTFTSQPLPRIVHFHMTIEPRPDNDFFVITSLTSPTKERGLYDVLRLYTPHPMLEGWAVVLFSMGESHTYNLIEGLSTIGMDWAYKIDGIGWDAIIDEAVKTGKISVPKGGQDAKAS